MAAEQADMAARIRAAAAQPENGSRRERRIAMRQARDAEVSASLFIRCAGATTIEELRRLVVQIQKRQERICAGAERILGGM